MLQQALGDRVSAFFVPAVCFAAFATWLAWFLAGEIPQPYLHYELLLIDLNSQQNMCRRKQSTPVPILICRDCAAVMSQFSPSRAADVT